MNIMNMELGNELITNIHNNTSSDKEILITMASKIGEWFTTFVNNCIGYLSSLTDTQLIYLICSIVIISAIIIMVITYKLNRRHHMAQIMQMIQKYRNENGNSDYSGDDIDKDNKTYPTMYMPYNMYRFYIMGVIDNGAMLNHHIAEYMLYNYDDADNNPNHEMLLRYDYDSAILYMGIPLEANINNTFKKFGFYQVEPFDNEAYNSEDDMVFEWVRAANKEKSQ